MGLPQLPLRVKRWSSPVLTTRVVLACAAGLTLIFVAVCGLLRLDARHDAERQADASASRLAAAVEQDVARNMELVDLTLQTAISLLQSPAFQTLSPQLRNLALYEHVPHDRYISFIDALDANGDVTAGSPAAAVCHQLGEPRLLHRACAVANPTASTSVGQFVDVAGGIRWDRDQPPHVGCGRQFCRGRRHRACGWPISVICSAGLTWARTARQRCCATMAWS